MIQEHYFLFSRIEAQLLDRLISQEVNQAHCVGISSQDAVPEGGALRQAILLQTELNALVVKPACKEFTDVEVFWLQVLPADSPEFVRDYSKLSTSQIEKEALGTLTGWRMVQVKTEFERKNNDVLKAHAERGLLLCFDGGKRVLINISGLPFFIHCFSVSSEIYTELACMMAIPGKSEWQ